MEKTVKRLGVCTGIDIGDWVYCPKDFAQLPDIEPTSVSSCRSCDCYEGLKRQDPDNPFNIKRVVLCTYKKE